MEQTSFNQLAIFGFSCILGVVLGLLYDVFRIIRMMINPKNLGIFLQDVIYFIISGVITFLFVLGFNYGESRFYILAGEGIGWIVYHITFGEVIYRCSARIVKFLKSKFAVLNGVLSKFWSKKFKNHKNSKQFAQ